MPGETTNLLMARIARVGLALATSICVLASVAAYASAAPIAQFQFGSVRSLTAGPDGRVWFFAKALDARGFSLYAATASGVIKRISLPGFKVGAARVGTIGVGGDQRLWVAATGISTKGRTTIYRISRRGKVTSFVLPAKRRATALAGDSAGRTWLIGYSSTRVGFVDRRGVIHSVPVIDAKSLEDVALGPDGRIWASASASVTRISVRGKARTFASRRTSDREHCERRRASVAPGCRLGAACFDGWNHPNGPIAVSDVRSAVQHARRFPVRAQSLKLLTVQSAGRGRWFHRGHIDDRQHRRPGDGFHEYRNGRRQCRRARESTFAKRTAVVSERHHRRVPLSPPWLEARGGRRRGESVACSRQRRDCAAAYHPVVACFPSAARGDRRSLLAGACLIGGTA